MGIKPPQQSCSVTRKQGWGGPLFLSLLQVLRAVSTEVVLSRVSLALGGEMWNCILSRARAVLSKEGGTHDHPLRGVGMGCGQKIFLIVLISSLSHSVFISIFVYVFVM